MYSSCGLECHEGGTDLGWHDYVIDYCGGTFTVSNLGAFGIESFTPLLNVPQVAILGVDAIFPRAVVNPDGTVGAEQRIGFSLTADHRVIDGADAARYLKDLCAAVADIDLTVLG